VEVYYSVNLSCDSFETVRRLPQKSADPILSSDGVVSSTVKVVPPFIGCKLHFLKYRKMLNAPLREPDVLKGGIFPLPDIGFRPVFAFPV